MIYIDVMMELQILVTDRSSVRTAEAKAGSWLIHEISRSQRMIDESENLNTLLTMIAAILCYSKPLLIILLSLTLRPANSY